jgi:cellulose synthase/poly-beta-1,6-N-acetylglucosamine synthase-like glycosyltransferase
MAIAGWIRPSKKFPFRNSFIPATLIVPFRNEQKKIAYLIKSIQQQKPVPAALFVDDHSTDDSTAIIMHSGMNCVLSEGEGKKNACATGIEHARTPLLLFTDADCKLPIRYCEEINNAYVNTKFDFAYGPVIYDFREPGLFKSIYFLDQLSLSGFSLGTGNSGMHLFCSGANMAGAKKSLVSATTRLKTSRNLSGDDGTLLRNALKTDQKILVMRHRDTLVTTEGPSTLGSFLRQRLRWGQKSAEAAGPGLWLCSLTVLMTCLAVIYSVINCISFTCDEPWYLLPAGKLFIDLLFLFLVAFRLGVVNHLWFFIPAWIFNVLYIPLVGITGLVYAGSWKGRKIRT